MNHRDRGTIVFDDHPTQLACVARGFFWWVGAQGRSPHAPGISKNAYSPVGIPLIMGPSGAGQ